MVWTLALAGCAASTSKAADPGAGAGTGTTIGASGGSKTGVNATGGTTGGTTANPSANPGVPVGPLTSASPPPASSSTVALPNGVKTFPLMSVPAPGGNNGNSGLAWVELQARSPDGEDPSQEMLVNLCARLGGIQASVPQMAVSLAEEEFITWVSQTKVLLLGSYLADLETGTVQPLDVPPWGARVSPDGSKVAYWGYADPTDGAKGPAVYDLKTGRTRALKLFRYEDWGLPTFDMGIAPQVTWLDNQTILFDGPYQKRPATYLSDLTTGKTGVWREKAWCIRASGDGRYVSFTHREAWLVPRAGSSYTVTIVDVPSGAAMDLRVGAPALGAALYWDRGAAGRFALVDGPRAAAGVIRDGKATLVAETKAVGAVVGLRFTAVGISFFDLERVDFAPVSVTAKVLAWPPHP